jgi:pimeloyl-ACP methyl ester carboxylesterase
MYVTIQGQRIFFDVVGDKLALTDDGVREKPTFIVLHGGPGFDHLFLRPDFDGFTDIAQVIYLDHRGNGRSWPSDPATWSLAQWGDDIKLFCDALGIEKPIVLGQSFGGMVAQSYASRHPEHPKAVIFSSTAPRMDFEFSMAQFEKRGGRDARDIAMRFWTTGAEEDRDAYMKVCMPLYNPNPRPGNARGRGIMRSEVYRHFSLPGGEMRRMDLRPGLREVICPVLVLGGDYDPITPTHLAHEIVEALPRGRAELHIFEDCGHGAFRDQPDRVFPVIRKFIERTARAA